MMNDNIERTRPGGGEPLSTTVVSEIASHFGVGPEELDPPLFSVVDPDALDTIFLRQGTDASGRITFQYAGAEVTVHADGEVLITE